MSAPAACDSAPGPRALHALLGLPCCVACLARTRCPNLRGARVIHCRRLLVVERAAALLLADGRPKRGAHAHKRDAPRRPCAVAWVGGGGRLRGRPQRRQRHALRRRQRRCPVKPAGTFARLRACACLFVPVRAWAAVCAFPHAAHAAVSCRGPHAPIASLCAQYEYSAMRYPGTPRCSRCARVCLPCSAADRRDALASRPRSSLPTASSTRRHPPCSTTGRTPRSSCPYPPRASFTR